MMRLLFALLVSTASVAQESAKPSSHCKPGEHAYLNANMSAVHYFAKPTDGRKALGPIYELRKTGKVLSICAASPSAPHHMAMYRFGAIGKLEMERVASVSQPFHIFDRAVTPHSGENILFFTSGSYTYCVFEGTAQGIAIGLTVLKGGRQVQEFNSRERDFEGGSKACSPPPVDHRLCVIFHL